MKILLIYPNQTKLEELSGWRYPNIHPRPRPIIQLGMLYLYSAIDKKHEIKFIDNNITKWSTQKLCNWCISESPDVIGFGGTLSEWPEASETARHIKDKNPQITVLYGGPNAAANPEKHVNYFDFVIRGYAENIINPLLNAIEQKSDIDIPGVCYKNHITSVNTDIDINTISRPDRNVINISDYRRSDASVCPTPVDVVVSSRGCPYDCRFCSSKYIWNRRCLLRDTDSLIDEIKWMIKTYGTKTIHFREDNFTINKRRLEEVCCELAKLNINWICQSWLGDLDRQYVRLMKESGCILTCCGFESANDSTLKYLRKRHTVNDILEIIDIFEAEQMNFSGGFMVGVLNEGEPEIANTLTLVKKLAKYPHSYIPRGAGRFVGFPISETYIEMVQNNLVAFDWQHGEILIPNTYHLDAHQVEDVIDRYW